MCEVIPPKCVKLYELRKQQLERPADYDDVCRNLGIRLENMRMRPVEIAWVNAKLEVEDLAKKVKDNESEMQKLEDLMVMQERALIQSTMAHHKHVKTMRRVRHTEMGDDEAALEEELKIALQGMRKERSESATARTEMTKISALMVERKAAMIHFQVALNDAEFDFRQLDSQVTYA